MLFPTGLFPALILPGEQGCSEEDGMKSLLRRERCAGLIWMAMAMATAMALLLLAVPVSAEYVFFGEAAIGLDLVESSGRGPILFGDLRVDGDHSFYRDWGEARLRHALVTGDDVSHDIYQASVSWYPSDTLTIVFGRHQIGWGMGWAFFPSDALHPRRLAAGQSGVVRGFDGASVIKVLSPYFSAAFALRGDEAFGDGGDGGSLWWEDLRYAALLQGYAAGVDLSISAVWKPSGVFRPGAGFSLQLLGSVLTADASVDFLHAGRPYPDTNDPAGGELYLPDREARPAVAVGIERSFTGDSGSLTLVAEYLWDSRGYSSSEREALFSPGFLSEYAAAAAAGNAPSPGRHYLYPMISGSWEDSFGLDNYALISLSDASVFAGHRLWWNVGDGFELAATATWMYEPSSVSEAALAGIMAAESADAGRWQAGIEAKLYF
jgi:hypothetical protein